MTTQNDTDTVIDATLANEAFRRELEERRGEVWDTTQLRQVYTVHSFCVGVCEVTRKEDGVHGALDFTHSPRFYHSFFKL